MRCAVIGLGEAGVRYATALAAAGYEVHGYDPQAADTPAGVTRATSPEQAVSGADVVLVLTGAAAARAVADQCQPALRSGACYADFTSSAPTTMAEIGAAVEAAGARFADVAILGPVLVHGAQTPLMVSGSGAEELAALVRGLDAPVEVLEAPPGAAMAHKLLRSVFMKGLASVVCEAVAAGQAAGYEDWIRDQIARQIAGDGHATIDRFLTGTRLHAERRAHEMHDTVGYLAALGVPVEMSAATEQSLVRMAAEPRPAVTP